MAAVFLDTTVLIDILRGRLATVAKLRRLRTGGDVPYTCAINVEEVVRAFVHLRKPRLGDSLPD
jgi:predicted nucleic acid-binding protein